MKTSVFIIIATVFLILPASLSSCSSARPSPADNQALVLTLQELGLDKYLSTLQLAPIRSEVQGWDMYTYPTEELRCLLGAGYFILARRGLDPDKTVLWLEGGGACYPGRDDCTKEAKFSPELLDQGLSSLDERNPLRSWNFIYVPYCDGSLHLGDSDVDYDGDGIVDHWHWGLKSTSAAVQLIQELFPASQKILVAGCSAGGGGTLGVAPVVRLGFPAASLYVFNASGTALANPDLPQVMAGIKATWNIDQLIPPDCPKCAEQLTYLYDWLLERDSKLKVGLYSSYRDRMVSAGWGMTQDSFASLLRRTTDAIHAGHPDTFKRYFVTGDGHCPSDYTNRVNGVSLWEWVGYLVNDNPGWVDVLE
jgi:Pectinacetylesterase